jgi:hypothetical protein
LGRPGKLVAETSGGGTEAQRKHSGGWAADYTDDTDNGGEQKVAKEAKKREQEKREHEVTEETERKSLRFRTGIAVSSAIHAVSNLLVFQKIRMSHFLLLPFLLPRGSIWMMAADYTDYTDDTDNGGEQKVAKEAKKCEQEAMEDSRRIRIHLLAGGLKSGDGRTPNGRDRRRPGVVIELAGATHRFARGGVGYVRDCPRCAGREEAARLSDATASRSSGLTVRAAPIRFSIDARPIGIAIRKTGGRVRS